MTSCPGFLKAVLTHISGSCITAKSTSFHSQKSCDLGNKLYGNLSNSKTFNPLKKNKGQSRIGMISSELHFTKTHQAVPWDLYSKEKEIR